MEFPIERRHFHNNDLHHRLPYNSAVQEVHYTHVVDVLHPAEEDVHEADKTNCEVPTAHQHNLVKENQPVAQNNTSNHIDCYHRGDCLDGGDKVDRLVRHCYRVA